MSILLQLRNEGDLLKHTEDTVGDGRVEEKEENNERSDETRRSFGSISSMENKPKEECSRSKKKRKKKVSEKVDEDSPDEHC